MARKNRQSAKAQAPKAQATYQVFARTAAGTVKVGPPTAAPVWRVTGVVSMLLEREDVANAWCEPVAA